MFRADVCASLNTLKLKYVALIFSLYPTSVDYSIIPYAGNFCQGRCIKRVEYGYNEEFVQNILWENAITPCKIRRFGLYYV